MPLARMILLTAAALLACPVAAAPTLPPGDLSGLEFRQHPGARLPLDTPLVDEAGESVRLGDFFTGKPVVLVLEYLHCRGLCGPTLSNLAHGLDALTLDAGKDFQVVAVSIDPRETAVQAGIAKAQHLARYHHARAEAGWHFLRGSEGEVKRLADAVGFPYRYDPAIDQYAHPAGITLAAPDGVISRYLLGLDYRPLDLRLGLAEAGGASVAAPAARLLLLCYGYDPQIGRYDVEIRNLLRIGEVLTILGVCFMVFALERKRHG